MTDIPVLLQKELTERFCLFSSAVISSNNADNTTKMVLALKDEAKIESVLLSDNKNRLTACLSTQVGCPCNCVFCKTGSLGFKRNLDSAEIVEQFLHLKNFCDNTSRGDAKTQSENKGKHTLDNIVFMGMGEPLLNLENVRKAISIFNDKKGLNFSQRRITVSTCGICDSLFEIAEDGNFVRLALSLPTANENLRQLLMPIAKTNPLEKIKQALLLFQRNGGGRITLEVPLLGNINTSAKDALSIASFAKGLKTVVNIIPWNPVSGLVFQGKPLLEPNKKEIQEYTSVLENAKLKVTKRLHKGRSVLGACGQLGGFSVKNM